MKKKDPKRPPASTEGEACEFKKSLAELKEGLISIAAILNKHGAGELWFGRRNDGKPVASDINEKTLRDISQAIAAHIEPKIYPEVTSEPVEGIPCIRVVFSGEEVPYFAYGRAYMRVADEDRQVSAKELERFILAKHRDGHRWEKEPSALRIEDLSVSKLKQFVTRAGLKWDNTANVLEKLEILKKGEILQAAELFFAKKPKLELRCAVFAGTTSATIVDRQDYTGDMLKLIEEAQKYILRNIHIGMRLDGLRRVDVPEISMEAVRETLINAFCHRDYRDPDEVRVAIYKDRVEIRSPGGLFGGMTIAQLRKGHVSHRRNPLIANMLKRIHFVEAWGRGMPLILEKAPNVQFEEVAGIFITSFPRATTEKTTGIPQETTGTTPKTTPKTTPEKLLACLRESPEITKKELSAALGLSLEGVKYHLAKLKKAGQVRYEGSAKAGRWVVVEGGGE